MSIRACALLLVLGAGVAGCGEPERRPPTRPKPALRPQWVADLRSPDHAAQERGIDATFNWMNDELYGGDAQGARDGLVPALKSIATIAETHPLECTRHGALTLIRDAGHRAVPLVPLVIRVTRDPSSMVRHEAVRTLCRVASARLGPSRFGGDRPPRNVSQSQAFQRARKQALSAVIAVAESDVSPRIAGLAMRHLASWDSETPRRTDVLLRGLKALEPKVRHGAALALSDMDLTADVVLQPFMQAIEAHRHAGKVDVILLNTLIKAVGSLGADAEEALDMLVILLGDERLAFAADRAATAIEEAVAIREKD